MFGWSVIANQSIGWDQAYIEQNSGSVDATSVLSTSVIPENGALMKLEDRERHLFHELGHTLGLRHEHESALKYSDIRQTQP